MGKAIVLLAAFLAVLLVAEASIYRTTVILDEEAEKPFHREGREREREHGGRGQGHCQEQFQKQQQLSHCQEFLRKECQQGGGSRGRRDELYIDMDEIENPRAGLQQCCQQLEEMDSQCRCDGLRRVAQQQQQRGQMGREEMRQVLQTAGSIPSQCNLSPGRCQFGSTRMGWF